MNLTTQRVTPLDGVTFLYDGFSLLVPFDLPAPIRAALERGTYETEYARLLVHAVRRQDRVVEGGTCLGYTALVMARQGALIRTFEADPRTYRYARHNVAPFGATVWVEPYLLSTTRAAHPWYARGEFWNSSGQDNPKAAPVAEVKTVQSVDIRQVLHDSRANVLALNVEGAEYELLTALDLSGIRTIVTEIHPWAVTPDQIQAIHQHVTGAGLAVRFMGDGAVHPYGNYHVWYERL